MNRKNKIWTEEEDNKVQEYGRNYGDNLSEGFRLASKELQREANAIKQRWYIITNPKSKYYKPNVSFLTVTNKMILINRKINTGNYHPDLIINK